LRAHVNEVDVHPVDLGFELRERVELRLELAPVVIRRPIARELLQRRQLHALRPICDDLLGWPTRSVDTAAQISELLFRNVDIKGANLGGGFDCATHDDLRCGWGGFENDKKWPVLPMLTLVGWY